MTEYTERQLAALGAGSGICRALNPERTFMCELDAGHDGDHFGFELPTVVLDECPLTPVAGRNESPVRPPEGD